MQIKIENQFPFIMNIIYAKIHHITYYGAIQHVNKKCFWCMSKYCFNVIRNIVHTKIYLNVLKYINMNWYYITI